MLLDRLQKGKAEDHADVQNVPQPEMADLQDMANDDDVQADSLVVVEVFEARAHSKLSGGQQLATVFDGENMYQVWDVHVSVLFPEVHSGTKGFSNLHLCLQR